MQSTSHLTRNVFRAILANRSYSVAECPRKLHRPRNTTLYYAPLQVPQRRLMFGFALGSKKTGLSEAKATPKNLEIALSKLVDLVRARRTRSRLPDDEELLQAFRFVFSAHLEMQRRLTRNETFLATEAFKHFEERGLLLAENNATSINSHDLENMLLTLALSSGKEKYRSDNTALARLVFDGLRKLSGGSSTSPVASEKSDEVFPSYVAVLARTGEAKEALEQLETGPLDVIGSQALWIEVLKGLHSEGRTNELWPTLQKMINVVGSLSAKSLDDLILFLAENDDAEAVQKIISHDLLSGEQLSASTLITLVELSIRSRYSGFAEFAIEQLEKRPQDDDVVAALLLWKAAQNPGAAVMKTEIGQKLRQVDSQGTYMTIFNRLIKQALAQNNSQLADAYIEMLKGYGLVPNASTNAMQLQHQIQNGDMAAASRTYDRMFSDEVAADGSDIPVLNNYIKALSLSEKPDYEIMMRVVDSLLERGAELDAEAVAGLCKVFLLKDELEEATGLLRHRVDLFPPADRARINAVFREFIVNPAVKDQRAFNAYELWRHAFPETPVNSRLPIMQSFFDRQRPDLACLVFGHMRQREDLAARPTPTAYAQCFAGIAQCRDIDGLQMVHNMLKLDLEVEPTTRIRNGLMIAFTACQQPYVAVMDYFWKILDSREGPTYSSFAVALRACETWVPQGSLEARKIIALMQGWNLEITKEIYDCYVGAIAGQSEFENAVDLIEDMEAAIGEPPDAITIGTFYNAIPWQFRKDAVEKWAKQAHPELWAELESFGEEIDEEWEVRYFKFDRSIDIEDDLLFDEGKYDPHIAKASVEALEGPKG